MRHRYHDPVDPATGRSRRYHDPIDSDDLDDCAEHAHDDYTAALKAALWLLGVIGLGFALGAYLVMRHR